MSIQERSIPALKTVFPSFKEFGAAAGQARRSRTAKRMLDVTLAIALLILVLPVLGKALHLLQQLTRALAKLVLDFSGPFEFGLKV